MIVLWAEPKAGYRSIIPRVSQLSVLDEIRHCEVLAFDPQRPRLGHGRIHHKATTSYDDSLGRVVLFEHAPTPRSVFPDEEVFECCKLIAIRRLEIVHIDMIEINKGLDLLGRCFGPFLFACSISDDLPNSSALSPRTSFTCLFMDP